MTCRSYLLVKARADQIPLPDNSVRLVIATPPDFGVKRRPKADYCTCDPEQYKLLIREFLQDAARIVHPRGHILLLHSSPRRRGPKGARRVVFRVLRKLWNGQWILRRIRSQVFFTHYVRVMNFPWWAIPIQIYRDLIGRYSRPGEVVVHVFSGSGNSAIAALKIARRSVLIDLHYHRQVARRLRKTASPTQGAGASTNRLFA